MTSYDITLHVLLPAGVDPDSAAGWIVDLVAEYPHNGYIDTVEDYEYRLTS